MRKGLGVRVIVGEVLFEFWEEWMVMEYYM